MKLEKNVYLWLPNFLCTLTCKITFFLNIETNDNLQTNLQFGSYNF